MRLMDLISSADMLVSNSIPESIKLGFVNDLEGMCGCDVLLMAPSDIPRYSQMDGEAILLVPPPHDKLYLPYLCAMICLYSDDAQSYTKYFSLFKEYFAEYSRYIARTLRPGRGDCEINGYYLSAYSLAVKHGFVGSEEEWVRMTESCAERAESAAERAESAAESAESAENYASSAEISAKIAQSAQESAKDSVTNARTAQAIAQSASESAKAFQENARTAQAIAQSAQESAKSYQENARTAQALAESAAERAESAAERAEACIVTIGDDDGSARYRFGFESGNMYVEVI